MRPIFQIRDNWLPQERQALLIPSSRSIPFGEHRAEGPETGRHNSGGLETVLAALACRTGAFVGPAAAVVNPDSPDCEQFPDGATVSFNTSITAGTQIRFSHPSICPGIGAPCSSRSTR